MVTAEQLYGRWSLEYSSEDPLYGQVSMEFESPNLLRYSIHNKDNIQIVYMTFKVKGNQLITEQISQPGSVTSVPFELVDFGHLVIDSSPSKTHFIRLR